MNLGMQVNTTVSSKKNASQNVPTLTRTASEDVGREDTFVDCPDEIETSESQNNLEDKDNRKDDQRNESDSGIKVQDLVAEIERLRDMHEKNVAEKERDSRKYEEEKSVLTRELTHLYSQLKVLNSQQTLPGENVDVSVDHLQTASLHEIISQCSSFLKNALDERFKTEEKVMELQSLLQKKDQEIDFLNAKVAELSESIENIVQSNSTSTHENLSQLYEAQLVQAQQVEEIVNRTLASVSSTLHQEELLDGSLPEKTSKVEKSLMVLVERYNHFLSESDQLRRCLTEVWSNINIMDGTFVVARDKILELARKEENLYQKVNTLEIENRKLVEQLEKQKSIIENANAEIGKLSAEAERERHRYENTKEKLSMAVTKGKALVQQRDSLKQMLAEKTSELEKCTIELQEKASALDIAEQAKESVAASEKYAASLQESLAEKDMILKKCEEILSECVVVEEPQPIDIIEKLGMLADENKSLKITSLQYNKLTDALKLFDFPETVASSELDARVRWLADSFSLLKEEASKLQSEIAGTKEAANSEIEHLTTSLLAETQEKSYLEAELQDLRNKYDADVRSQDELIEARGALNNEIEHLTASLLAESQEKNYLQSELENLRNQYEGATQNGSTSSLEKDRIVQVLLEASGLSNDSQQELCPENSDMDIIIDSCLAKIKEKTSRLESCQADVEIIESFKTHLYIRDQEMSLYKLIIEEGISDRAELNRLSDELAMVTQELDALKHEKTSMQKSIEQLEDRCGLLKEKLSMAVKKGKGLVQERENLKGALNEKNNEIDKLKSELQQSLSTYNECQDQITKLSLEVQRISQLETDLVAAKEHTDQLEQFLAESNSMLQRVMESIEGVATPANLVFREPVEKVKWIAGYFSEHEIAKEGLEQELMKVKDEASSLASRLLEAEKVTKSLEEALSIAENKISQILDEKKEVEVSKGLVEKELQKEREEASYQMDKFEEVSAGKRELEDALSLAENNISRFKNERDLAVESQTLAEEQLQKLKEEFSKHIIKLDDAEKTIRSLEDALSEAQKNVSILAEENNNVQVGRADLESEIKKIREEAVESQALAEEQLQKLKEEFSKHITKLDDAEKTIRSLEEALSEAQKNVLILAEQNNDVQVGRADLESEIKKIREEADSQAIKLSDASLTIKSLEDALANSENNMAVLVREKKNAEEEILALRSKLESCMEEQNGTRGSTDNLSLELSSQLSRLQSLLKDETFSSLLGQCFTRKFESLNNMNFVLKEIGDYFHEMDTDVLQNSAVAEDDPSVSTTLPSIPDIASNMELLNDEVNAVDSGSIVFHIEKMNEKFHLKGKMLADKIENVSNLMDKSVASLLRRLLIIKDSIVSVIRYTKSLEQQVKDMETYKQSQEDSMASLENDFRILSSACADAIHGLESNVHENVSALRSINELVKLDGMMSVDFGADGDDVKMVEKLSTVTRQNQDLGKVFREVVSKLMSSTEDMQKKLKESQVTYDEVLGERDLYKDRILKLGTDLEAQRSLCNEMTLKLDHYKEKEDEWRRKDAELSTSLSTTHEVEDYLLSASQVRSILEKMKEIEVPDAAFAVGDSHDSADVRRLVYVIDSFNGLVQKVTSLSHEKEELQSTIDEQILEIEALQKQIENHQDSEKDSEKMKNLIELESGLQNIIRKLGGSGLMDDHEKNEANLLLPLLDKLVMATVTESESLKSKNEELVNKLLGTQKVVNELSNKVKLLEDSNQARVVPAEIIQERGASLSPQSEISEVQDMGALGKSNNVPLVPSAAVARTLRKGSSDHLAINIGSESERLIINNESDEDKGRAFKSLNTSGLIPRQGKTVADRIDGIWVSGSRALMSRPRGRLGLIAYWLVLHLWLLGTIL